MDMQTLRKFFMWCTILNGVLYIFSAMMCAFAGDWIYRVQTKWFHLPREVFSVVIYSFLGMYKIVFLVFNVVPWVALLILA